MWSVRGPLGSRRARSLGCIAISIVVSALAVVAAISIHRWRTEVALSCMIGPGLAVEDVHRICALWSCRPIGEAADSARLDRLPYSRYEQPRRRVDGRLLAFQVNDKLLYVFVNSDGLVDSVFWARRLRPHGREGGS